MPYNTCTLRDFSTTTWKETTSCWINVVIFTPLLWLTLGKVALSTIPNNALKKAETKEEQALYKLKFPHIAPEIVEGRGEASQAMCLALLLLLRKASKCVCKMSFLWSKEKTKLPWDHCSILASLSTIKIDYKIEMYKVDNNFDQFTLNCF